MAPFSRHPSTLASEQLQADCDIQRLRRSGPGGQHRNKVETAVRLTHRPTGITAMASERRSQAANLTEALRRLRINLALDVRTTGPTAPSALWNSRCSEGRITINPRHADFPSLLAEALDVLHACGWDVAQSSSFLGCTFSQLLKLLRREPRSLMMVNQQRISRGLKAYE